MFGVSQFFTSNFLTVELTDVVAAIVTLGAVLLMLRSGSPSGCSRERTAGRLAAAAWTSTIAAVPTGRRPGAATPGGDRALPDHHRDLLHRADSVGEALARRHRHQTFHFPGLDVIGLDGSR